MEIVDKLYSFMILVKHTSHSLGLWLREGVGSWVALTTWPVLVVAPEVAVVTVDVNTFRSIIAIHSQSIFILKVVVFSFENELAGLLVLFHDCK